ncbi:hypothetical protein I0C86_41900 [Plantactinospora sp. S1510]|uniref:DUF4340 domain-containing protein n=1 Tax=Plantactinospora alkalitolerans TaxID=2789879 RepID=A0ABS0HA96_9ACTN|nr:hypothetical protein [Plantactinospora alkalitolerans]MBF9135408.1 hypothetical protein [Plantactinospora alkalitolerans]
MTERIRSLLDAAVEDTRPRVVDPVSAVLRRGRASRRHRLAGAGASGVVAVALLATGGLVVANRGGGETTGANPSASASAPPTLPSEPNSRQTVAATVTDEEVRANGLILTVPDGWRVVSGQRVTDCEVAPRSVLVNVVWMRNERCHGRADIIRLHSWFPPHYGLSEKPSSKVFSEGVSELVLPGGQPAWLSDNDILNFERFQRSASFNLAVPWAGTLLEIQVPLKDLDFVLGSIRSEPVVPGRLVLPETPPRVTVGQRGRDRIDSTDAAAIAQVLERLRGLDQVVQTDELPCASAQPLTPGRKLAAKDMATVTLHYPSGFAQAVVAISSTDECAFATSSMGGRVRLPAGFLAEIRALLTDGEG